MAFRLQTLSFGMKAVILGTSEVQVNKYEPSIQTQVVVSSPNMGPSIASIRDSRGPWHQSRQQGLLMGPEASTKGVYGPWSKTPYLKPSSL